MKSSDIYVCSNCDSQFSKWQGRCEQCGKWGTLEKAAAVKSSSKIQEAPPGKVVSFNAVKIDDFTQARIGIDELDRVLGGGIIAGSIILLGGEPGIGKSTLVLEVSQKIKGSVLYVSGEESASQIKTRIDRLKIDPQNLNFLGETNIEAIVATVKREKPALAVIDSIQTVYSNEAPSGAGSINQVRICTTKLLELAKQHNVTILIIGHVTKYGEVAGPKTLEHLVDVVLYLEGDRYHSLRILRGIKNRFGSTNEVGVFEMTGSGLKQISNPTAIFLNEKNSLAGSIVTPTLEGSRIFLVEVQALVTLTSFGYPQRKAQGYDLNRLQMLIATLTKNVKLKLANQDVYLNLVGGLKATEPAIDLAVCLAIASALKNKKIQNDWIAFGEVGLGGEIRPVSQMKKRLVESQNLGFKTAIIPPSPEIQDIKNIKLIKVSTLAEALEAIS